MVDVGTMPSLGTRTAIRYGCDELGRLESALVHTPGVALRDIDQQNFRGLLWERVPEVSRYIDEHLAYRELLQKQGVRVHELSDLVSLTQPMIDRLPNLTFLDNTAVVTRQGALLSAMAWRARRHEETVVREALQSLGVPILYEFDDGADAFEGCQLLSPECLLVCGTERHARRSIFKFIVRALHHFREIIYVDIPKARRFMHADRVFGCVRPDLALAYLPALSSASVFTRERIEKVDFCEYITRSRGIELLGVSEGEQRRMACSFLPIESGRILHYEGALEKQTIRALEHNGVDLTFVHGGVLMQGGGSLRSHVLPLHRQSL
jgi:arginine deiminase